MTPPARLRSAVAAILATLAPLAPLAPLAVAACDDETSRPPNTAVETQLQQILAGGVAKPGVLLPGAVAHYESPAYQTWSGAAGLGDVAGRVPMRPDAKFRAGSVLKTFLATVVLQHVEAGTLSLDATLPTLLPEAVHARVANAGQITLRMLLNHTSGIPEWVTEEVVGRVVTEPRRIWSADDALAVSSQAPPDFAPGTAWHYSNTNYTLVGLVLDRAAGKPWRVQVRERVIDRLGLADTSLPEPGDTNLASNHARGYQDIDGNLVDLSGIDPSMAGAAGGHAMVTTARDLSRFLDALLAGGLFAKPSTWAAMTAMVDAPHESGLPHRYGLGLEEFTLPNGAKAIGHSGSAGGYAVMMFRLPTYGTTLVTAINTSNLFTNALELFIPAVNAVTNAAIATGPR